MIEQAVCTLLNNLSQLHPLLKYEPAFGLNCASVDYYESLELKLNSTPTTRTYKHIIIVYYVTIQELCLINSYPSNTTEPSVILNIGDPELKTKCEKHIKEMLCSINTSNT